MHVYVCAFLNLCYPCMFEYRRTMTMLEQRKALVEQRKRTAAEARLQKEAMVRAMESLRTDGAKADKVIKKALSGKVSLSAIVQPERSQSAKTRKKKSKSTSELLGVKRQSASAGDPDAESSMDMHMHLASIRAAEKHPAPLPYVSPYEQTNPTSASERAAT